MTDQPTNIHYQRVKIDDLSGPELVAVYNQIVGTKSELKKFETVGKGRARVNQALDDKGYNGANVVRENSAGPVLVLTNREVAAFDPQRISPSLKQKPLTDEELLELRKKRQATERTAQRQDIKKLSKKARKRSHLRQTGETKQDMAVRLVTQKGGATGTEILKAFGDKKFSGTLGRQCRKRNLELTKTKREDGEWVYTATK